MRELDGQLPFPARLSLTLEAHPLAADNLPRCEHVCGAGKSAARCPQCAADHGTDGAGSCIAPLRPGRLPGDRTGHRVRITLVMDWLTDAVAVCVSGYTEISCHCCARCAYRENNDARSNLKAGSHRVTPHLPSGDVPLLWVNSMQSAHVPRVPACLAMGCPLDSGRVHRDAPPDRVQ